MIDLANALIGESTKVTIITGRLVIRENPLSDEVKIVKIIRYNRCSRFLRSYTWFVGFLQILFLIKTRYKKDYLLIVSNPPLATLIPMFCRNKYSYLIYDVYPDTIVQMGVISKRSVISQIWERANRNTYCRADHIFTLTNTMAKLLNRYCSKKSIRVVPIWSNNEFFKFVPKEVNPFLKSHNLGNRFIVLYSGNLGTTHYTIIIPQIAKLIKNENIMFLIIGEGDQKETISKEIKRLNLTNCLMLPLQPVDVIPYSFSSADLAIVSLGRMVSSLSLPSKVFNFMSAGLPLLCVADDDSELTKIVVKYRNGKCFNHLQISAMASFIEEMAINQELQYYYRENSLKASADFTSENADIIANLVSKSASN